MAAELKEKFGVDCELIASGGGVYEVTVDDTLLFSKKALGRFPDDDEVIRLIEAR
ncbi:MAG: SelT/SelW/SelH family protein [Acidobacteria bacterium]|nr:SelT/SelW/SelH family protein [Acidobacteriota bacterium]NIM61390.1 SelT/SelW/SelH family protein [Acidobacteriota bacterium]NIO58074.1 SelT/SelW/SelH family protein [Acidobacteriota bacterium]NIQ29083.1 SelT/SelW/SelH family protein [Acidobacteriota bacterium]NIQ83627.1 SelT/SelW/SelH family protein [Acidobacteriota bacterium]